jgi:predicted dehydrogenase
LSARSRSLCADYGGTYAAADVNDLIADPKIKLVFISSNHASHAEYAIKCLDAGKSVHIEKPHVISNNQLHRLSEAQKRNPDCMVFLGFNRPRSLMFQRTMNALSGEQGPLAINWFVVGHQIPEDHWYYDPGEGSRVLGNLCHWTDLTLHMVSIENAFPCEITTTSPAGTKTDYFVQILFADHSIATIAFSAKGETFEGVRETLNVQRGNVVLRMEDFFSLIIEGSPASKTFVRDHGHEANILNTYESVRTGDSSRAISIAQSEATAKLFLAVAQSVERGVKVSIPAE